jgi:predicted DNA-binding transcriptional regulator AlpA
MQNHSQSMLVNSKLLAERDAAQYLQLKPATLAAWRCTKRVNGPRYVKLGGAVRYPVAELDAYIARSLVGGE